MSKKTIKKVIKLEESEDEIEEIEDIDIDDIDNEDLDEDTDIEFDDKAEETCLIDEVINEDINYFDTNEVEVPSEKGNEYISKENRISCNRLTKYEMVRILGERTKQLTMGAKPLVKNFQGLSYEKIAEEEFLKNMIPFKIKRPLPNGKYEIWTLDELNKDHLLSQLE